MLLVFFHYIKILDPIERLIINAIKPFSGEIYSISADLATTYNNQASKKDLLNFVKILEEENRQLKAENAKLKSVQAENNKLRENLNFFKEKDFGYVVADIIAEGLENNINTKNNSLIIDKGSQDGIAIGLAAVNKEGIIIGKITEVKKDISKVSLLTSGDCLFAAAILGESQTIGITEGELNLTIKMNFIPQKKNIKIKDQVITSGLEKEVPKGLLIGEVSQINNNKNNIWQSVVIEPLVDFKELDIISVIIP